jgi:hypothetical protein
VRVIARDPRAGAGSQTVFGSFSIGVLAIRTAAPNDPAPQGSRRVRRPAHEAGLTGYMRVLTAAHYGRRTWWGRVRGARAIMALVARGT